MGEKGLVMGEETFSIEDIYFYRTQAHVYLTFLSHRSPLPKPLKIRSSCSKHQNIQ